MKFGPLESSPVGRKQNFLPLGIMVVIMMSVLGAILARLAILTVFRGGELRSRADDNRIFIRKITAPRGIIFDRTDIALTRNAPEGRVYPFGINFSHVIGYVGEVSEEEIKNDSSLNPGDIIGKSGLEKQYDKLLRGIAGAELVEVDANGNLLGVLEEQLPQPGEDIYTYLDADLQIAMTESLGGKKGAAVAIDPEDGAVFGLISSPPFDPNLFAKTNQVGSENSENSESQRIRKSENQKVGISDIPIVRPSGSPSIQSVLDLLNDTVNLPLFNRAISGEYPPGSIFKLVTATAGLSESKINARTLVNDTGEIRVGAFRFGNWYFDQYGKTEGEIGISRALGRSNDIFFYKVGEWLGPELLAGWAEKLGLGKKTGIDLSGEADGLVPNSKWKEKITGERWFLGNTYHMAIGQGDVQVTPLQAVMMAGAAVTGRLCVPRIGLSDSQINGLSDDQICKDTGVSEANRNLILEGMIGACSSGGTAFPFFQWNESLATKDPTFRGWEPPAVACKTGTAQHGGKQTKPHAWITVAGPIIRAKGQGLTCPPVAASASGDCRRGDEGKYDLDLESEKRIVLVVMLEEAGEGSYEAGPAAKKILEKWFKE